MMTSSGTTSAVVIGASIAGLAAARVLGEHVDHVTILERDHLGDEPGQRRGVPQGRHAHVLLGAGQQWIGRWFPRLGDDLEAAGAIRTTRGQGWFHLAGAYRQRGDFGAEATLASRPLLESTIRRHLLRWPNVTIEDGVSVDGLVVEGNRVTGVYVDGKARRADLVVDCSGRNTRFVAMLESAGFPAPDVSEIHIDMAYASRILSRRPDDFNGQFALLVGDPRRVHRIAALTAIEGDRWLLTLAGFHGDDPPTDDAGFLAFARSLPAPLVADVIERSEALSPVMTYRMPSSQLRHFDRLRRVPAGFLALGDSICSFNPIYGQGMSSAVTQAAALGLVIDRHGLGSRSVPRTFYRLAAGVVADPWRIAAGGDFANPATTGPKPRGTDLVNRYLRKVFLACHTSAPVAEQMMKVQNLVAPRTSLLRPTVIARVMRSAPKSPVVTGEPRPQPVIGSATSLEGAAVSR